MTWLDLNETLGQVFRVLRDYGAQLVAAIIGVIAIWFRDQIFHSIKLLWSSIARIRSAEKAIASDSPWLMVDPRPPEKLVPSAIPILTIANLKGGVGKTTLAANLAGYFAKNAMSTRRQGEPYRILLIDLDFQGSLSSMVLHREDRFPPAGSLSKASQLICGDLSAAAVCEAARCPESDRIQAIPAYYDLARIETRTFMQWMLQTLNKDLRYILHDVLRDPVVQHRFDIVIIDAPPRLTTGSVQALCASTHVLVPTRLDGLSGEAVASFFDQMETLRRIWPQLRFVGVVGTMVGENPDTGNLPSRVERDGEAVVKLSVETICNVRNIQPPAAILLDRTTYISDHKDIRSAAGDGIAYLRLLENQEHRRVRSMINRLGDAVRSKLQ